MKTIRVGTNPPYAVCVGSGLLQTVGDCIRSLGKAEKVFLVSDDTVFSLYGKTVLERIGKAGLQAAFHVFPHGEESKNLSTYGKILSSMAENRLTRSDVVVALGGGVTGDLAGFAASTYMRGIRFVQVPTTLLAAVDSSVGGKTGVDLPEGKNLVGAFHQPSAVLTDIDSLQTLPHEQYLCGVAETIKYGIIGSETFFDLLVRKPIREDYEETICNAVEMKRDIVEKDERESGVRMLLNFGHTFGHAAEACSRYSLLHGQAVAMGMATIAKSACRMGFCSAETVGAIEEILKRYGLPVSIPFSREELLPHILLDKKNRGGMISLVVPEKIGKCTILPVRKEEIGDWLSAGGVG